MELMNLDLVNSLRTVVTVCAFASFLAVVFWAWSGSRKQEFDQAARMPLDEDDDVQLAIEPIKVSRGEGSVR